MPSSRIKVRDVDHGFAAFMRSVRAFERQRPRIRTGLVGEGAAAAHPGKRRATMRKDAAPSSRKGSERPPLTIVQIGMIHEFGLGRMPTRSFLRANFDDNHRKYQKALVQGVRRELLAATRSGVVLDISNTQTLRRVALKVEGDIKRRIRAGIRPANTPATIRRKGSSTPLIDTGRLIGAIGSEIRPEGAR
jgi:hypothetical protein